MKTYLPKLGWILHIPWIFEKLMPGASAFCFGPFIVTKYEKPEKTTLRHEKVHRVQFYEMLFVGIGLGVILSFFLPFLICLLLAVSFGGLFYTGEYLYRYYRLRNWRSAYRAISWEREARAGESNDFYFIEREWFAWRKFL